MFAKLSALLLALPLVSALDILPLIGAVSGNFVTIQWTASTTDPSYFSLELANIIFNKQYAIASDVQTSLGQIMITLPQVPADDNYTLVAIPINNSTETLATSSAFSIAATNSSSTTSASTTSSTSSSSGSLETTSTSPVSTVSSAVSSGTSLTTSAATSTPSSFNSNGAAAFKVPGMVPAAAVLLSAVAGAAMVF